MLPAYARFLSAFFVLGIYSLLAACNSSLGKSTPGNIQNETINQALLTPGQIVGKLRVRYPELNSFILRATLPLPKQVYPISSGNYAGQSPFVIVDSDGSLVAAQTEIVTRYPLSSDGADVVELIAPVHRPNSNAAGSFGEFSVMYSPHTATLIDNNNTSPRSILRSVIGLPSEVQNMLSNSPLLLQARDLYGNLYQADLLADNTNLEILKKGNHLAEIRTYTALVPVGSNPRCNTSPQPNCTMSRLMGVNAYITTMTGENSIKVALQFNNGGTGRDAASANDDPVGMIYFDRLTLLFKNGWNVLQQGNDPFVGTVSNVSATQSQIDIVRPINEVYPAHPNNPLHSMEIFAQFHRRLILTPQNETTRANILIDEAGQGFASKGSGDDGFEYFSWWNPQTARYFPQRLNLPMLPAVSLETLNARIETHADASTSWATPLNTLRHSLQSGTATGYPITAPVMGWAHPHGEGFGGGPGGGELFYVDGIEPALAASNLGIVRLMLHYRMLADRSPIAMINADGQATQTENWLFGSPSAPQLALNVYGELHIGSYEQLGYNVDNYVLVKNYQQQQTETQCRYPYYDHGNPCNIGVATYEYSLPSYDPYDQEHQNRGWRSALPLAWLANDSLAKHDIRMHAEIGQMTFTDLLLPGGWQSPVSMHARLVEVNANPDRGFALGRYEGWVFQIFAAAYSMSNDEWRQKKMSWLNRIPDLVGRGQCKCDSGGYCDGIISRKTGIPFHWVTYNNSAGAPWCNNINGVNECGNFPGTQSFENDIIANGLWSLYASVFLDADNNRAEQLREVLVKLADGMSNMEVWAPSNNGPWNHTVIANLQGEKFCNTSQSGNIGYGQHGASVYPYYDKNTFGMAYMLSNDDYFMSRIEQMIGGAIAPTMQSLGTSDIGMNAVLHTLADRQ